MIVSMVCKKSIILFLVLKRGSMRFTSKSICTPEERVLIRSAMERGI